MSVSQSDLDKAAALGDGVIERQARERWASDSRLREMHGCATDNPDDPLYVARLARYVRVVLKTARDQRGGKPFAQASEGDIVSQVLANPNVAYKA